MLNQLIKTDMDFFEKLDELHAKDITPEEFKKMNGVSQEEVMQKVMDFVDKFDAKQAELEKSEKKKTRRMRPAAAVTSVANEAEEEKRAAATIGDKAAKKAEADRKRREKLESIVARGRRIVKDVNRGFRGRQVTTPKVGKTGTTIGELRKLKEGKVSGVVIVDANQKVHRIEKIVFVSKNKGEILTRDLGVDRNVGDNGKKVRIVRRVKNGPSDVGKRGGGGPKG